MRLSIFRKLRRFSAVAFSWYVASVSSVCAAVVIQDGEDWSFPAWVQPRPYSGFFNFNTINHPLIPHVGKTLTWYDLNPAENVYNFSLIEQYLESARQKGGMAVFRLKSSILDGPEQGVVDGQRQMIPQWVVDKHNPATFRTAGNKLYVALWNEGVQREFRKFVLEIGRRKFLEDEAFLGIYLHGFSNSDGEELSLESETYGAEARAAGLTPAVLEAAFKYRMDAWAEAVGPYTYKVAWVGSGNVSGVPYDQEALDDYALDLGLGGRNGFIEHYYYGELHPPIAGQSFVDDYMISDWSASLRDGRLWSDENEETDEYDQWPAGTTDAQKADALPLATRSPYFRAAQAGLNFLWVSPNTISWAGGNAGIPNWFRLVAGKGPEESPDAAVWLREAKVRGLFGDYSDDTAQTWKNFERLLMQRDVPGAMTQPAHSMIMPYVSLKHRTAYEEALARRTDLATQNPAIAFQLDAAFKASLVYPVQIKVHYLDAAPASTWTVRVSTSNGVVHSLGTVVGEGMGAWRTATFDCDVPFIPGALSGDTDFDLHVADGGDLTVRYVRVVRTVDAVNLPKITVPPTDQLFPSGATGALHVVAEGSLPLSYVWKKDGQLLPGATGPALPLIVVESSSAGSYSVIVSNQYGSVESAAADVSVLDVPPSFADQPPAALTFAPGSTVRLGATVLGSPPFAFQWQRNGVDVPGATANVLVLPSAQPAASGLYRLVATNAFGTAVSTESDVLIVPVAPAITTPPQDQTVALGGSASFTVAVSGSLPFAYQWNKDGAIIPGANGPTLALSNVQLSAAGAYHVVVSNEAGSVESAPALLRVTQSFANWIEGFGLGEGEVGPSAAPAGDGVSNLIAYALGLDPRVDKTLDLPQPKLVNSDGDASDGHEPSYLSLDVGRIPLATGIRLSLEVSPDLQTWSSGPTATAVLQDSPQRFFARDNTPLPATGSRFARLVVAEEPLVFALLIDDFEDGNTNANPVWNTQLNGNVPASSVQIAPDATQATPDGTYSMRLTFAAVSTYQYARTTPGANVLGGPWSAHKINGVRFWFKGSAANGVTSDKHIKVQLRESDSGERWSFDLPAAAVNDPTWQLIVAPFSAFYAENDGSNKNGILDVPAVNQFRVFYNSANRAVVVFLDKIEAIRQ